MLQNYFGNFGKAEYTREKIERQIKDLRNEKWPQERQIVRLDKKYTGAEIEHQMKNLKDTNWLPGRQIRRPSNYPPKLLTAISETWLQSKLRHETKGQRLQTILVGHFSGMPNRTAYAPDGTVLATTPANRDACDPYRSIKYLDAWIEHYGFHHWPSELVGSVTKLYYDSEYDHVRIFESLSKEKVDFCITDPSAIANCIWMDVSSQFKSLADEDIASDTRHFFHVTRRYPPFAGRYVDQL